MAGRIFVYHVSTYFSCSLGFAGCAKDASGAALPLLTGRGLFWDALALVAKRFDCGRGIRV